MQLLRTATVSFATPGRRKEVQKKARGADKEGNRNPLTEENAMEELTIVVLDPGVTAEKVAQAATCCPGGKTAALRAEPEPEA